MIVMPLLLSGGFGCSLTVSGGGCWRLPGEPADHARVAGGPPNFHALTDELRAPVTMPTDMGTAAAVAATPPGQRAHMSSRRAPFTLNAASVELG